MSKKPTLFIVSGPSGAGKSSLMESIMDNMIVSFTTREPRLEVGEVNGKDYYFITKEMFLELKNNNALLEYSEYNGHYYGITEEEFQTRINKGDTFFISDFNGMKQMKKLYDNCVSIYIYTDKDSIREQLESRKGSTTEFIEKRMKTYEEELKQRIHYDFVVQNTYGKFDETAEILKAIVKAKSQLS